MQLNIHFCLKQTCPHDRNFTFLSFVETLTAETFCRLLLRNAIFILEIVSDLKAQNSDLEAFQFFLETTLTAYKIWYLIKTYN